MLGVPFYGRAMGAYFNFHNVLQPVNIAPLTRDHLSTSRFPEQLTVNEEYYHFQSDPRTLPNPAIVLLSNSTPLGDNTPAGPAANTTASDGPEPHPLAWYRSGGLLDTPSQDAAQGFVVNEKPSMFDNSVPGERIYSGGPGRMFHTVLGHANETWMDPGFQGHILGGMMYVMQNASVTM